MLKIAIMIGHIEENDDPILHHQGWIVNLLRSCMMKVFTIFVCSAIIIGTPYVQVNMMENYIHEQLNS